MVKEGQKLIQIFERIAKVADKALAAVLLWSVLPDEFKKTFGLDDLFQFYRKASDSDSNKSLIRQEIFRCEGSFSEWRKIFDDSKDDPALNLWATRKTLEVAKEFSDYLWLYKQGCDVIDKLILSTTCLRDRFDAYEAAKNAEDKARLKQFMFTSICGVEEYVCYICWSGDVSVLKKIEHAVLPHKEWVRLYLQYGKDSYEDLFVFLFHKRCQSIRDFEECANILYCERFSIRTAEANSRIEKDLSRVRLSLVRLARTPEQFSKLFGKMHWYYGQEVSELIRMFQRMPKPSFEELGKLYQETHYENRELKKFLFVEMLSHDLNFSGLMKLWRIKGSDSCDSLLWRIFNAAETLEEYAMVHNIYYGFTSAELKNTIRERSFRQMQILASQ